MNPDPKWLEILKASGWQTTGLAAAFGTFLFLLPHFGLSPAQQSVATALAALAFLVCLFLALGSIGHAANEFVQPRARLARWMGERRQARDVREYIPYMTDHEREIIAYLLAKNQKMFSASSDGGHAATLLSRGIVVVAVRGRQIVRQDDVPMAIPDHVWAVLAAQKDRFPYKRTKDGVHPWRVSWMER